MTQYLTPSLLLSAYADGAFPMALEGGEISWFRPDPRAILPLDGLRVSHSLRRTLKKRAFKITYDRAFREVVKQCAAPGPGREETWISEEIEQAYVRLHDLGFAHSVEVWGSDGQLTGGLYGVTLRGLFAGESMFSRERDSSKVALYHLVSRLQERGFTLLDTQFLTPHLARMGAVEISAAEYDLRLNEALTANCSFA